MGQTLDIGQRIELVPMDGHFEDITIGLYQQDVDTGVGFLVHTYSSRDGAQDRIAFIKQAMQILGGMVENENGLLQFLCGHTHLMAVKRVFLEACKLGSDVSVTAKPLYVLDRKSGLTMVASPLGDGKYHISAKGEDKKYEGKNSNSHEESINSRSIAI